MYRPFKNAKRVESIPTLRESLENLTSQNAGKIKTIITFLLPLFKEIP